MNREYLADTGKTGIPVAGYDALAEARKVIGEGKMVFGIEPTMIGTTKAVEGTKFNHRISPFERGFELCWRLDRPIR